MRGEDRASGALFSYVDDEARIPTEHPLRAMRRLTNRDERARPEDFGALRRDWAPVHSARAPSASFASAASLFDPLGAAIGRTVGVRHAVRWFVGLTIDEKVFDASTFSKNRDGLLTHEIAQRFLASLLGLGGEAAFERRGFFGRWNAVESWASRSAQSEERSGEGRGTAGRAALGRNLEIDFRKSKR